MQLLFCELQDFRSYPHARVDLHPRANLFLGPNGMGKTNFIEAVYLLATASPLRGHRASDLIREGKESARVSARVAHRHGSPVDLSVEIGPLGRRLFLHGKPAVSAADYFGHLEVVAFTPADTQLFGGPPKDRRRFLDRVIFNHDPSYLDTARRLRRSLEQRNRLLEGIAEGRAKEAELDAWDEGYAALAAQVTRRRSEAAGLLRESLQKIYSGIFGTPGLPEELVDMHYRSEIDLIEGGQVTAEKILPWLAGKRRGDLRRRSTQLGPHRDEILFTLAGRPAGTHASQGQKRALMLALKLAEAHSLAERRPEPPVVLLDDLSSELDARRTERVIGYLSGLGSQLLVTSTAEGAWAGLFGGQMARFEVGQGPIEPLMV